MNAVFAGFAYFWAYPGLETKTLTLIMAYDVAISGAAVFVAGLLYWGSDYPFNMLFFAANWFVFSIVTMMIIELPCFLWFANKYGLKT